MNKNVQKMITNIRKDVRKDTISVSNSDAGSNKKSDERTQAHQIIDMVMNEKSVLFRDQFNRTYIALEGHGGNIMAIRSSDYQKTLCYQAFNHFKRTFTDSVIKTAVSILDAKAFHEGEKHELHVRVMGNGKKEVWYDLADGNAVKVTKDGWKVVEEPPIIFKRFKHQAVQDSPISGGNVIDVLQFFNIEGVDSDGKLSGTALLAIVWIIVSFIPGFPHPILVLHGQNGAGKSTFFRFLKRLIDPSGLEGIYLDGDVREMIQKASHHWFLPFDNVTGLTQQQSDMLCRFCTGEGTSKRELYSNDSDFVYKFKVVMGLNGINLMAEKGDLLDRCLLLQMKRIEVFREEKELDECFLRMKPQILGAIFDIIVIALDNIDNIELKTSIRLADFARWACAVTEALGQPKEDFLNAYSNNMWAQNEETIEASPVAKAIIEFMEEREEREEWKGAPNILFEELEKIADKENYDNDPNWPKNCRALWKRIAEVLPALHSVGIKAVKGREKKRYISLYKVSKSNVEDDAKDSKSKEDTEISMGQVNKLFEGNL